MINVEPLLDVMWEIGGTVTIYSPNAEAFEFATAIDPDDPDELPRVFVANTPDDSVRMAVEWAEDRRR